MASNNYGLLLVMMEPTSQIEEEFNEWLDTEHMPERLSVPGFLSGTRYTAVDGPLKHLSIYDLENPEVLKSDAYAKISPLHPSPWSHRIFRHIRGARRNVYQQLFPGNLKTNQEARGVLLMEEDVDSDKEEAINQWYVGDHIPNLIEMPHVVSVRRFVCIEGTPKYLSVYEFSDFDLLQDEDFKKAFADKKMRFGEGMTNVTKSIFKKYHAYTFNHISYFK
jgi:hypothetical protein